MMSHRGCPGFLLLPDLANFLTERMHGSGLLSPLEKPNWKVMCDIHTPF
jgi:hypothetical protein